MNRATSAGVVNVAREINTKRIEAERLYTESKGKMKLIDISKQLDIPEGTIRGWKNRYKWNAETNVTLQKKKRSVADKECSVTKNKNKVTKDKKEKVTVEKVVVIDNDELTDKQKLFCIYYIKYFNATKAYQKAYNCSYDIANANGYRMMVIDGINKEIETLKANKFKGAHLEPGDILQRYIDIALADITDFLTFGRKEILIPLKDGEGPEQQKSFFVNYVEIKESSEIDGTMISEISEGKEGIKLKLYDKMKALEFVAKNIGLLDVATQEKIKLEREKFEYIKSGNGEGAINKKLEDFFE